MEVRGLCWGSLIYEPPLTTPPSPSGDHRRCSSVANSDQSHWHASAMTAMVQSSPELAVYSGTDDDI